MAEAHQSKTPQPEETPTGPSKQPEEEKTPRRGKPVHTNPKPKKQNPISAAVSSWLRESPPSYLSDSHGPDNENPNIESLVEKAPKRWVVYEPMVLLPSGSFSSAPWPEILVSSTAEQKTALWANILREISPQGPLTHLAINEGIPLNLHDGPSSQDRGDGLAAGEEENTLRSPSGLRLLYGDFGPALPAANQAPTADDFDKAFWVSTKQNGITQIWAPRYTMFSRGNIKEKARLLSDFPAAFPPNSSKEGGPRQKSNLDLKGGGQQAQEKVYVKKDVKEEKTQGMEAEKWAVDLYAGIGYFVFSYAKLGFRLLCWEINPWSVEGLRRGAVANGWDVVVLSPPRAELPPLAGDGAGTSEIQGSEDDARRDTHDEYDQRLAELVAGGTGVVGTCANSAQTSGRRSRNTNDRPQIIVLLESNEFAERRIRQLRKCLGSIDGTGEVAGSDGILDVVHVNCGFLPSSDKIWGDAWRIMVPSNQGRLDQSMGREVDGWLHLHENVGVRDIEARKVKIQGLFDGWAAAVSSCSTVSGSGENEETGEVVAKVEHVEMVKTFAPDVWHVVFDVHVTT